MVWSFGLLLGLCIINCLFSTNYLSDFFMIIAGLVASLSRFLEGLLFKSLERHAPFCLHVNNVLHWLPSLQHIFGRIAALVWRCLSGCAMSYFSLIPIFQLCQLSSERELLVHQAC